MVRPAGRQTPKPAPTRPKKPATSAGSAKTKTTAKRTAPKPKTDTRRTGGANGSALAPAGSMAARREFNSAPLRSRDAFKAYKDLTADSFAGPDDIRLRQISRQAQRQNVDLVRNLSKQAKASGLDDVAIYGRAKTPFSTFGKLREAPGTTVGSIKDLSGARMDINPNQPNFQQYYKAQDAAGDALGDAMKLKQDYIKKPNAWGYTGRIHHHVKGADGLTHELQIGSKDLSGYIDKKLTTAGGDKIKLHDATGYKGQLYGANVPKHLQGEYTALMKDITRANKAGNAVADVPELQARLSNFYKAAGDALPDNLAKPPPSELSRAAKIGGRVTKGLGALGVVGGGFQVAEGVGQIKDGDAIEGGANVTAGTGSMVAGGALIAGRVALGTTTGGAVAVVDGAKDIYVGIRDGNVEKAATGGVKTAAGGAMIAGVATANPILIAGGAIAYGGAVVYENRKAIANGAKKAWNWATSWW